MQLCSGPHVQGYARELAAIFLSTTSKPTLLCFHHVSVGKIKQVIIWCLYRLNLLRTNSTLGFPNSLNVVFLRGVGNLTHLRPVFPPQVSGAGAVLRGALPGPAAPQPPGPRLRAWDAGVWLTGTGSLQVVSVERQVTGPGGPVTGPPPVHNQWKNQMSAYGCGSNLNRGKPQVLVHVFPLTRVP